MRPTTAAQRRSLLTPAFGDLFFAVVGDIEDPLQFSCKLARSPPRHIPNLALKFSLLKARLRVVTIHLRTAHNCWYDDCGKTHREPSIAEDLHQELTASLPEWFGRPEANTLFARGIRTRDAFMGLVEDRPLGLIVIEYQFGVTCSIWWLGVHRMAHRKGLGRALIDRAAHEARARGC